MSQCTIQDCHQGCCYESEDHTEGDQSKATGSIGLSTQGSLSQDDKLVSKDGLNVLIYYHRRGTEGIPGTLRFACTADFEIQYLHDFLFLLADMKQKGNLSSFQIEIEADNEGKWTIPLASVKCIIDQRLINRNPVVLKLMQPIISAMPNRVLVIVYDDPSDSENYLLFPVIAASPESCNVILNAFDSMSSLISPRTRSHHRPPPASRPEDAEPYLLMPPSPPSEREF